MEARPLSPLGDCKLIERYQDRRDGPSTFMDESLSRALGMCKVARRERIDIPSTGAVASPFQENRKSVDP